MIFFKANMLLLLLTGSALALPKHKSSSSDKDSDSSSNSYFSNSDITNLSKYDDGDSVSCSVNGVTMTFNEGAAKKLAKIGPSGNTFKTYSGYPHEFSNSDDPPISWDSSACNSDKVTTLELPIFSNGDVYQWNGSGSKGKGSTPSTKKPDPGRCRVVYSEIDGHYCGVMCHNDGDAKGFKKCT